MSEGMRMISFRTLRLVACCVLAITPLMAFAQVTPPADDLHRRLDGLDETNRAMLRELQEIRRLLERFQAAEAPAGRLPPGPIDVRGEPFRGSPNARVAIIEFSDYQCPFCARFTNDAYVQIGRDYVDAGKVKYIWRDLPLDMHPQARKAAEAAHCAGAQGKFWAMHDRLFQNQKALAPADLTRHAEALGLAGGEFQSCLDSSRYAADIAADIADASSLGIEGTPSFLIGLVQPDGSVEVVGMVDGARPYGDFKAALDRMLSVNPIPGAR